MHTTGASADVRWSVGIDVGGTFVDVAATSEAGDWRTLKRALDASDPVASVIAALDALCADCAIAPERIGRLVHGTTIATNALLERTQPPVGVLATRGFADVLTLGRQSRRDLYARCVPVQTPVELFPERLRFEIGGRIAADGTELEPLDEADVEAAAAALAREGVASVAICLLHAHVNDAHERRAAQILAARAPGMRISLSSEVDPRPREFERALTTALDAYLAGCVGAYLDRLARELARRGYPAPLVMRSLGGVAPLDACARRPIALAMSGPAAAVLGVQALLDAESAAGLAISMDIGGTTTDLCVLERGAARYSGELAIGSLALRTRSLEVTSVAVGGGSVVRLDAAGGLRLGPRSQGAFPGPACFGRGGRLPTLTDAFLVAGFLPETLAGGLRLDRARAAEAIGTVAAPLGLDVEATARSVVRVANTMLAEAVRQAAIDAGADPREGTLVAAGGGGALHAAEVAALVGAKRVLVPPAPGIMAAYGLLGSPVLSLFEAAVDMPLDDARLSERARALEERSRKAPSVPGYGAPRTALFVDACYAGQEFMIEFPWAPEGERGRRFDEAHRKLRGQAFDAPRRARGLRLALEQPAPALAQLGAVRAEGEPSEGRGPRLEHGADTTIWIPPGWKWRRLANGALGLEAA